MNVPSGLEAFGPIVGNSNSKIVSSGQQLQKESSFQVKDWRRDVKTIGGQSIY